jgi:predicted secreted protein
MLRIALLLGLLSLQNLAHAENEPYNRVDFQVEATREIANDLLVAGMSIEVQDKQPARVAQQINSALNDALKKAAVFGSVKVTSGGQNTYPVYGKNNQVDAWRGHAEIRLESRDFKAAGELIMLLQSTLQLTGLEFSLAPDTRAQTEDSLVAEGIEAFQRRADSIRAAFGAHSYRTVRFSLNSGMPPTYPQAMIRAAPMVADAAIPRPEFAGGDTRMTVQVSGTIELQ